MKKLAAIALCYVLLTSACGLKEKFTRTVLEYTAPAVLVKEELYIDCRARHASVKAVFHLKTAGSPSTLFCYFPGPGYPMHFQGFKSIIPQAAPSNFRAYLNGKRLPVFKMDGLFAFPVKFKKSFVLEIQYKVPYFKIGNKNYCGYILRTGRYWKGPIGKLHIYASTGNGINIKSSPPYTEAVYTNIEPEFDLLYEISANQ